MKLFMRRNSDIAQISRRLNRGAGLFPSSRVSAHAGSPRLPRGQVAAGSPVCPAPRGPWAPVSALPSVFCLLGNDVVQSRPSGKAALETATSEQGDESRRVSICPRSGDRGALTQPCSVGLVVCVRAALTDAAPAGLAARDYTARMRQSWAEEGLVSCR